MNPMNKKEKSGLLLFVVGIVGGHGTIVHDGIWWLVLLYGAQFIVGTVMFLQESDE